MPAGRSVSINAPHQTITSAAMNAVANAREESGRRGRANARGGAWGMRR